MTTITPRALNEKSAAEYLSVSTSYLRQARMFARGNSKNLNIKTPGPPFINIGRKIVYLVDDLDAWLESLREVA